MQPQTLLNLFFFQILFISTTVTAQTYLHPTTGIDLSYAGACLVNTSSGSYYDDGGSGSNYSLNINNLYRAFCPSTIGNCMSVTFSSFQMEGQVNPSGPAPLDCYYDYLSIGNGAAQNSTNITIPGVTSTSYKRICGSPAVPFTATSTAGSGCLIMRYYSDYTITMAGWAATLSSVACGTGPNGTDNNDCARATPICADLTITTNSTGPGLTSETCNSCVAGAEHHSNWYYWTMYTGGTLAFNIDPVVNTDDYDFALYGPMTDCSALSSLPARCSYSDDFDITGLRSIETDNSEIVTGNSYVDTLHVKAGEKYYLFIDHWTPPSSGYVLDLILTDGASLDCGILPVELLSFTNTVLDKSILLEWETATEVNSNYYFVEKSNDGKNFSLLTEVNAAENTSPLDGSTYLVNDNHPYYGINYYKLSEVDNNGNVEEKKIVSCMFTHNEGVVTYTVHDLSGRTIYSTKGENEIISEAIHDLNFENGIYVYTFEYEDGTIITGKFIDAK